METKWEKNQCSLEFGPRILLSFVILPLFTNYILCTFPLDWFYVNQQNNLIIIISVCLLPKCLIIPTNICNFFFLVYFTYLTLHISKYIMFESCPCYSIICRLYANGMPYLLRSSITMSIVEIVLLPANGANQLWENLAPVNSGTYWLVRDLFQL